MHGHGLIAAFPKLIITIIIFLACFLMMTLAHDHLNHGVLTLDILLEHRFASFFTGRKRLTLCDVIRNFTVCSFDGISYAYQT